MANQGNEEHNVRAPKVAKSKSRPAVRVSGKTAKHKKTAKTHIGGVAYGPEGDRPRIWILRPVNGLPATYGNGTMICFDAPSRKAVDEFHAAALDNGGYDEGKPGIRSVEDGFVPNYYAAFVRDPTGNKLSAGCDKPE